MEVVRPSTAPSRRDLARTYRDLASQCREMARTSRRPGALLLRAAALDETAEYLEPLEGAGAALAAG
jgi:hypothetical protein